MLTKTADMYLAFGHETLLFIVYSSQTHTTVLTLRTSLISAFLESSSGFFLYCHTPVTVGSVYILIGEGVGES